MLNGGQEPAELDAITVARIRLTRRFAVSIGWKVLLVAVIDFVLLRIWAPDLVNMHNDLALAASVACLVAAILAALWLAFQLWIDVKRFSKSRRGIPGAPPLKIET